MNESAAAGPQSPPMLDRIFGPSEAGSNVRTAFIAGLTVGLTMVRSVFVNPQMVLALAAVLAINSPSAGTGGREATS